MSSRRIGEPNPRLKSSGGLKFKQPMKFEPANLAAKPEKPAGHPAVVVPTRPPGSREIIRGWLADRVVDVRNGEEADFQELLDDCEAWCKRYGYKRPHRTTVGRMLAERPHHSIRTTKTTWIGGVRLKP